MPSILPFSLEALRSHSIFVPPASSSSEDGWELVDSQPSPDGLPAPANARLVMRDKDVIVASGKQVRMTSLAGEGWEMHGGTVGGYKTLQSPHLTFTIHQLVLNPTGRLLAVVGHHQLVVLVLPRAGFASSVGGDVPCRSFPIDEYQHSPSSTNTLTKVRWHPWGEGGNSLWVLCGDGKLFEYDILRPRDPVQTFDFLPNRSKMRSSSTFRAIDPLSEYASSFTFSQGTMDFGPLMVYALMANGDIYTIGPVLPLHTDMPAAYLNSLQAWTAERSKQLKKSAKATPGQEGSADFAALVGRRQLQEDWVAALVRQGKAAAAAAEALEEGEAPSPPRRRGFGLRDPSPPPARADAPPPPRGYVRVHPPHLTPSGGPAPGMHRPLMRQGPLLFDPAPEEVGNGDDVDEQAATDIAVLRAAGDSDGEENLDGPRVNIVAIAWSGGRVDLGVEAETPGPRWITSRDPAPADTYLPIVESVLSSFPADTESDAADFSSPYIVFDPIHTDVVYVAHAFGVDAVSVAPWVSRLLEGESDLPPSDVACMVEASPSKPIVGVATFCNITLGYGLLALAASGQLATVEMDFRVQDREGAASVSAPASPKGGDADEDGDEQSLLSKPFDASALVAGVQKTTCNPRAAVRKAGGAGAPMETIGPEQLRALADAASQVRSRAEAVRGASGAVERRADLQVAEYARQLRLLREASTAVGDVRSRSEGMSSRAERLATAQSALAERLDAVLNSMMAEYRPQIGDVERRWFDELERVRARVAGMSRREPGFAHRAQVLKEQLGVVRPLLEADRSSPSLADSTASATEQPGSRQLRPLQAALELRSDELARLLRKMESLSVKVADVDDDEVE